MTSDEAGTNETGPESNSGPVRERVVIRDKRKIDTSGPSGEATPAESAGTGTGTGTGDGGGGGGETDQPVRVEASMGQPAPAENGAAGQSTVDGSEPVVGEVIADEPGRPFNAELEAARNELDERVRDLQRLSAEYANYRKRVDRDRGAVVEQASGLVISALLPILDDLDRAREHDDLVGPAAAMAEQLNQVLGKFGLTGFGEVGDAFDPTRHEAVAHETSTEVSEPTCVSVMRRGYLLGDRLLRAALVGVADPE